MATLALFVALGGGAFAAVSLPRNSVGEKQLRRHSVGAAELRRGAVTGRAVRDGSLGTADLSASARRSLRGMTGPAGPPGSPGAPAVTYHAVIASGGTPTSGNATGVVHLAGSGDYTVRFAADVTNCTLLATLGNTASTANQVPAAGRVTVSPDQGAVHVRTYDAAGSAAPASFHVAAVC
jgi:hypothetical protein